MEKAGSTIKIMLGAKSVEVHSYRGRASGTQIRRAAEIVAEHLALCWTIWEKVHIVTSPAVEITIPDLQVLAERNRVEDERTALATATNVAYRSHDASIELRMHSGIRVRIPRSLIGELDDVPTNVLRVELQLAAEGTSLSVRSRDIDIAIPGLLRDLFGLDFQRLGGRAKTVAKAAAARANGKRGGRPRLLASRENA